jgi:hypothetical protein
MTKISNDAMHFFCSFPLLKEAERKFANLKLIQELRLKDITKNLKLGNSTGDKLIDFVFAVYGDVNTIEERLQEYKNIQTEMENHVGEYMIIEIWGRYGNDVMYACGTHELKATYICLIKEGMNFSFEPNGDWYRCKNKDDFSEYQHTVGRYNVDAVYLGNSVNDDSDIFAAPKPVGIASDSDLKYNFIVGDHEVRKKLRSVRLSKTVSFGDNRINVLNFKMYIIMNMMGRNIPNMICQKRLDEVKRLWIEKIKKHNSPPKKTY